jgi:hypothetical protein
MVANPAVLAPNERQHADNCVLGATDVVLSVCERHGLYWVVARARYDVQEHSLLHPRLTFMHQQSSPT